MKMKSANFKVSSILMLTALFLLNGAVLSVQAQTAKRKTTRPKQAIVYPSQPIVEPTVVSRAEDNQPEPTTVNAEPAAEQPIETYDDKIDASNKKIKDLSTRLKSLESTKQNEYDEKQKRLLLNLDILSRAEQRAENLRKQLFDIIEKESTVKTKLDQMAFDSRPENIERMASFAGSLRPEEIRDQRKKSLDAEKKNLEQLLQQIQSNRLILEQNVEKADALVERVRSKMEKEIDDALTTDDNQKQ